jgi:hypothetical protein
METMNSLIKENFRIAMLALILISLVIIGFLTYYLVIRLQRKISNLTAGRRKHQQISAIKKINQEFLKEGEQIDAFKSIINLTIDIRNFIRRLSGEMRNIECVYNENKLLKSYDLDILNELKKNMEGLLDNLNRLTVSKKADLAIEFLNYLNKLQQALTECDSMTARVLGSETTESAINLITHSVSVIESNALIIKELHDGLIKNFQEIFSKDL